jgi:propionyl-CoA synthetase
MGRYQREFRRSLADPDQFWRDASELIDWYTEPSVVLDRSIPPFYRWFTGGILNTCFNAVDRHVRDGRAAQPALIYDSPVTGSQRVLTYQELLNEVARFAGVLHGLGVAAGDRVVIYMPMVPEAVVAMLACARIGAVHSVVFGGFAAQELPAQIEDARPVAVVSASGGIEVSRVVEYKPILDRAIKLSAHKPHSCVILQRPQVKAPLVAGRDLDWAEQITAAQPVDCVPVAATDPLYILYTSGTTGKPKGVVRDNGGHAVALRWSMQHIYDTQPGDVYWAASDIGWVVGHSYIVYAPLLAGCTTVLYEGKPVGTPDAGAFWRVIEEHRVKALFTAPTAFRVIKKEDPGGRFAQGRDLSSLRYLFLAGERLDPETYRWARELLGIPVINHWWQTETGWAIAANLMGLEPMAAKPGSPTVPVPGYDVHVVDLSGADVPAGADGEIVIRLPLPPGCLPTLWGDDQRYADSYLSQYPGCYLTGDGGHLDADGYLFVMGRTDDVINVARPPVVHRRDGGGAGQPSRSGRMRRDRGRRSDQGAGTARLRGPQVRLQRRPARGPCRAHTADARPDRPGGGAAPGGRGGRFAQDPLGEDLAQDHARHRRRQGRAGALDPRRPGRAGRAQAAPPRRLMRGGRWQ